MAVQAAKDILLSITDFQKEFHVVKNQDEVISSLFYREFIKTTWHCTMTFKLQRSLDGDDTIYSVNNSFHFLLYTYLRTVLPQVRVKSEYKGKVRIAWCHNAGTNQINTATFQEDDDTYDTWDSVWNDIFFQFFQKGGADKRENHNLGIGNIRCLEEWTDSLPSYPINVSQPWFYSWDHAQAFPIFYKNTQIRAYHRYNLKRQITDILRMKILGKDNKWKSVPRKKMHTYLDIEADAPLNTPELWGRYAYVTDKEISAHKCLTKPRVMYIKNVEAHDVTNPNRYGTIADINLKCNHPCLALFWVAENRDATLIHNYSNYTTNTDDLYRGWDPIKTTSLEYGNTVILKNMPSDHFNIAESREHFLSSPSERGFHALSIAWNSANVNADTGIVFSSPKIGGAKLFCRIDNTDIFADKSNPVVNEDEDSDHLDYQDDESRTELFDEVNPNFITRVRLLIIKKFTIEEEGTKYKFSVK